MAGRGLGHSDSRRLSSPHGDSALQSRLGSSVPLRGAGAGPGLGLGPGPEPGPNPGSRRNESSRAAVGQSRPSELASEAPLQPGMPGVVVLFLGCSRSVPVKKNYSSQQPAGLRRAVPGSAYDPHRAPRGLEEEAGPGARGAAPAQSAAS